MLLYNLLNISYGIAYWGSACQTYINRLEATLSSLNKNLFYMSRLYPTALLYK